MPADFRSDTVTRPTSAMRRAIAEAAVGDDVLGEDPSVAALEAAGAALLGVAAALFLPSGTMANQVAIHVHCRPGDELVCERRSHVFLFESAGAARFSGTQCWPLDADDGFPAPAAVAAAVRADDPHLPRSRLLCLENTHNMAGGRVLSPARLAGLVAVARDRRLAVHLDGARLYNAAVALDVAPAELTCGVDSVSLCLSKGLGAPVGSLLGGSREFVAAARRARKAFGGGMRQAGILAAAGTVALEGVPARLAADHRRARALADGLTGIGWARVARPETNIVMMDLTGVDAAAVVRHLAGRGVLVGRVGQSRLRLVTHGDLGDDDVARCIEAAAAFAPSP